MTAVITAADFLPCSFCNAPAGVPCTSPSGRLLPSPHKRRRELLARLQSPPLSSAVTEALHQPSRAFCALRSCGKPVYFRRYQYKRQPSRIIYSIWCASHRWQLYAGGIRVAVWDDWDE